MNAHEFPNPAVVVISPPPVKVVVVPAKPVTVVVVPLDLATLLVEPGNNAPQNNTNVIPPFIPQQVVEPDTESSGMTIGPLVGAMKYAEMSHPMASKRWRIRHGLNRHPKVTVVDSAGEICEGEVTYVDADNLLVVFSAALGGTAYLV